MAEQLAIFTEYSRLDQTVDCSCSYLRVQIGLQIQVAKVTEPKLSATRQADFGLTTGSMATGFVKRQILVVYTDSTKFQISEHLQQATNLD